MNREAKIYIAGHQGLVGSAILNNLLAKGYHNLVCRTHQQLDLTCQQAVADDTIYYRLFHILLQLF